MLDLPFMCSICVPCSQVYGFANKLLTLEVHNGESSKDCINAGCFVFAHSGGASAAIACEAEHPGCFSAIYAFEPGLVSDDLKAGDTKCDPVLNNIFCL